MKTLSQTDKDRIAQIIRQFLADDCHLPVSDVTDSLGLFDDLGIDSLIFIELIKKISIEFEVNINLKTFWYFCEDRNIQTVGMLIAVFIEFIEQQPEITLEASL